MSSRGRKIQQPIKLSWKFLVFPTDIVSFFIKLSFFVSTVIIIILISCSLLPDQHRRLHRNIIYDDIPDVGSLPKTNISHLLFGIGGSASTWDRRRHYTELWWKPTVTRGFVWLEENPVSWPDTSPPFRISEDTSRFNYTCWYGSRSAIRVARIVKESFDLGLDNVRWFVMGDDDTVFFTENLVNVLAKYDHRQMYYIGGNSESVEQDVVHSYTMAYGGGGFAISYPLAAELVRLLDGCINRYADLYGSDQKVQACLSEIGVPVTKELGFHQMDVQGNPYGILAAHPLAPLVSLHHLDYYQSLYPGRSQVDSVKHLLLAHNTDPSRTLQHTFCYDPTRNWTISVSWGYSVQLYPWLATAKDLETAFLTFQSWRTSSFEPFTFNTRPVSSDPCERPVLYFLDEVDRTVTTYRKYADESEKDCDRSFYAPALDIQYFKVSTSNKLSPNLWRKALRRQCCEVMQDEETAMEAGEVKVKMRRCDPSESLMLEFWDTHIIN